MKGAFARQAAQCEHVSFGQLSGVHVASPIDEVMRFVNEEDMSATVIVEKAPQIGARVEDVVVVADDEIGIERELERELERADAVLASEPFRSSRARNRLGDRGSEQHPRCDRRSRARSCTSSPVHALSVLKQIFSLAVSVTDLSRRPPPRS